MSGAGPKLTIAEVCGALDVAAAAVPAQSVWADLHTGALYIVDGVNVVAGDLAVAHGRGFVVVAYHMAGSTHRNPPAAFVRGLDSFVAAFHRRR